MQAQTPEVSAEKATTPADELRLVSVEQLNKIHRELDACQKAIWLAGCGQRGYGFDPAYVTGAQEQLKQIEALLAAAPAQGQQVEWRTTAVMLEQANAGLAQLNGKLRAELSALKAQQVGQEPAGEVHLRKGGGISLLHVELAQPLPPGTKLYTAPQPAPSQDVAGLASSDPVAKAEFETRLRKEFESRWPKPKGVTWGAGINDYCVSEFAEGIALSYPDMWMAYKAGAMRTNQ